MAGIFYSIKEAAKRLRITEKEVKKLIEQGTLRGFRIGSDLLLKAEEVDNLACEKSVSVGGRWRLHRNKYHPYL